MTVVVSFITPGILGVGGWAGAGVGRVRIQERLTIGNSTSGATALNEIALIGNGETGMIAAAYGTTPDAAATMIVYPTPAGLFSPRVRWPELDRCRRTDPALPREAASTTISGCT